jgi:hypothetical protein
VCQCEWPEWDGDELDETFFGTTITTMQDSFKMLARHKKAWRERRTKGEGGEEAILGYERI